MPFDQSKSWKRKLAEFVYATDLFDYKRNTANKINKPRNWNPLEAQKDTPAVLRSSKSSNPWTLLHSPHFYHTFLGGVDDKEKSHPLSPFALLFLHHQPTTLSVSVTFPHPGKNKFECQHVIELWFWYLIITFGKTHNNA